MSWKLTPNNAIQATRHPAGKKGGFRVKLVGRDGHEFVSNRVFYTNQEYNEFVACFNKRFISG